MKHLSDGLLRVLPINIRLGWKATFTRSKTGSVGWRVSKSSKRKKLARFAKVNKKLLAITDTGACAKKLFTAVIYGFLQ